MSDGIDVIICIKKLFVYFAAFIIAKSDFLRFAVNLIEQNMDGVLRRSVFITYISLTLSSSSEVLFNHDFKASQVRRCKST